MRNPLKVLRARAEEENMTTTSAPAPKSYEELELERFHALAPLEIPGYEIRDVQPRTVAEIQKRGR